MNWKHKKTGLKNTGFVDAESEKDIRDPFFIELKSTKDASREGFVREAFNYGYHTQIGGYSLGYKYSRYEFPTPILITVETSSPYPVNVFRADSKYLEECQDEYEKTLLAFKYCLDHNLWHKTYDFFRFEEEEGVYTTDVIKLPGYYKKKYG